MNLDQLLDQVRHGEPIAHLSLAGQDLRGLDLAGAFFDQVDLSGATMSDCQLQDSQFINCVLTAVTPMASVLPNAIWARPAWSMPS